MFEDRTPAEVAELDQIAHGAVLSFRAAIQDLHTLGRLDDESYRDLVEIMGKLNDHEFSLVSGTCLMILYEGGA